LDLLITQSWN